MLRPKVLSKMRPTVVVLNVVVTVVLIVVVAVVSG